MHPLRLALLVLAFAAPALAHAQVSVSEPWVRGTVPGFVGAGLVASATLAAGGAASC